MRNKSICILIGVSAFFSASHSLAVEETYCKRSVGGHTDYNQCVRLSDDELVQVDSYGRRKSAKGMARVNDNTFCDQSTGGLIDRNQCFKHENGQIFPVDSYGRKRSISGNRVKDRYEQID